VGANYTVVQNEQHCELLNLLVDEAGAHFETAGSLREGRETFVTMKLPNTLTLEGSEGSDDIELYLAAMSSHDGTTAWRVIVTPVRIVCANTQRIALNTARASYSIRHTRSAAGKIAEARHALGIVFRYCDAFETAAQHLINQTLELDEFQQIVDKVWPTPTDTATTLGARAVGIRERRNSTLRDLFTTADTQTAIRGTRWAGLQAITEYLDHHTPAKDEDVRAHRVLTSHSVAERKQRAYDLLTTR
jgi:phage/plasmid-like protein (TIGR03299 family)